VTHRITLIPGDGIGPEVTAAARRVLDASGAELQWDVVSAGATALEGEGSLLPESTLLSIRRNGVALKGPVTTPVGTGFRSVNVALRKELGLYAAVRPCRSRPGVSSRYEDVDIVVVRENTEDLYAGIEFEKGAHNTADIIDVLSQHTEGRLAADSGISIKAISETASRKVIAFAFDYARANGRKQVTAVHKANIMKSTDGLFLEVASDVAGAYPDVEFDDWIVDALCADLVQRPQEFDVLVLPNLYGDIVSDLCAGLVGGMGVAPGANVGESATVFEPVHGTAPSIAGQNKANPMAAILSGVMMLRHIGERIAADRVEGALTEVLIEGEWTTADLRSGGDGARVAGTSEMADAIIARLRSRARLSKRTLGSNPRCPPDSRRSVGRGQRQ